MLVQQATPKRRIYSQFSEAEDDHLRQLIRTFGTDSWGLVANYMNNRTARQVRERFKHYLSCPYNNKEWTDQEDSLLLQKVTEYGFTWTKLTDFFRSKTDLQIKARWMKLNGKKKGDKMRIRIEQAERLSRDDDIRMSTTHIDSFFENSFGFNQDAADTDPDSGYWVYDANFDN